VLVFVEPLRERLEPARAQRGAQGLVAERARPWPKLAPMARTA